MKTIDLILLNLRLAKNDLSLFNELSRENYDITDVDDGADLTGIYIAIIKFQTTKNTN